MNKKYKLIKKFPGFPELGTIVTYYSNWEMYGITNECIYKRPIIENNPEFWELIQELPVGTKVVDTYPDTKGNTYEKLCSGKWKFTWIDNYTINEDSIGDGKRFQIIEETPLPKKDYEILELAFKRSDKPEIRNVVSYTDDYILALLKCENTIHSVKRLSVNNL
jgi:hypothetical protein